MTMTRGNLFILSAPSGAGKSSLIKALLDKQANIKVSVSHTTRSPRPGENNGEHYHFVTVEAFKALIEKGDFFEWAQVFENYYGTSKQAIEDQLNNGIDVFLDIDWQGARQVRSLMPEVKTIFILPPSQSELEQRLNNRGQDSQEVIAARMSEAKSESSHYDEFDYVIVNDDFETALTELEHIVVAARLQTKAQQARHKALIAELLAD
ncbi:guanylate kinase [Pseudoalteromonas luteoviolacea]|uniref:Guanylate kinase n=1 Tax=Pseudoalteromonas luteoviolacea S4054 TaxID=1129367 RepID=A0A0F6A8Z1_9GAMM|nr:guanylate kinase [Pseudoalteromonas luteoviolacea]AOT06977.1 guanylate kinase [Pseudoalteromonas luteoviolacea]AOT11895.1 guanylate kinase [Pseudoalteromonas luteoviolacea]AOT16807.1 guanylate kinase [Pseudoalteromonas luteoviolacea]KKE82687.1 guanylate kinase [Pseudoalteromonas luteoviolacea S4054]KZN72898.1 guanylate kinase [Pseudoalteromonas luteoviolacea S4047-1]